MDVVCTDVFLCVSRFPCASGVFDKHSHPRQISTDQIEPVRRGPAFLPLLYERRRRLTVGSSGRVVRNHHFSFVIHKTRILKSIPNKENGATRWTFLQRAYNFLTVILQYCRYIRDWRYHKEERVWITRVPGMEPHVKTNSFERGTYYFFDAQNWRKVAKEFRLEYDKLEDRPMLPNTLHHNPNQPTVMAH